MNYTNNFPALDGLFAATRTVEVLNQETQASWHDERGRLVSKMFLSQLVLLQDSLPSQLTSTLSSVFETDLLLQKARQVFQNYGKVEGNYLYHLAESREERQRSFSCADLSRNLCNSSQASAQRSSSLVNQANATTLHF